MLDGLPHLRIVTGASPRSLLARLDADAAQANRSPFADEIIVVQSLGMERWVRQQLAIRRGIAASLQLPFPAVFCERVAEALWADGGPALDNAFEQPVLVWRIAALLDEVQRTNDPRYAPLHPYLRGADAAKRHALARRVAARFDEYRLYRPALLLAWEAGEVGAAVDDANEHAAWQAAMWQHLTGGRQPMHFARWLSAAIAHLEQATTLPAGLPERVSVFGVSTLPPMFVQLLRALARFVPVTCYVLVPSPDGWHDTTRRHPLEAAFGETTRELLAELLAELLPDVGAAGATPHRVERDLVTYVEAPTPSGPSRLARLQRAMRTGLDIRVDAPPSTLATVDESSAHDRSLLIHECHSPVRELEVLRDQLLDAFAADQTLRPHDVLVMVPDVDAYAPLAAMVLGDPDGPAEPDRVTIPYRLADRALTRDTTAAQALARYLALASSRFTASEVLDLLTLAPVQRAAGIAPSQFDRILRWVSESQIRWGRDGLDRGAHGVPSFEDFTWRQGLDRLLAGYAAGRVDALVEGVAPVAGDTVGDTALLGHFIEWVEALIARVEALRAPRPLLAWSTTLQDTLAWLVSADSPAERAAVERVERELVRLATTARALEASVASAPVTFDVAQRWLAAALEDDPHDTGFLTGGLTLCAMKPMRAIPFKVIAMLGLDDRAFPRRDKRPAFDLIGALPARGDRNVRADDRQLFLDTILCAESQLILSWVGRSQQNNAEIAPSVVVAELLDVLDAEGAGESTAASVRDQVVVTHALQPFNPDYFDVTNPRRFSFDARWARSVAAARHRHTPEPFISQVAAPANFGSDGAPPRVIDSTGATPSVLRLTVSDLMAAWSNPARFYCTRVLRLRLPDAHDGVEDVEPLVPDALDRYRVQQDMVEKALRRREGNAPYATGDRALALATGVLPPGALGAEWYTTLHDEVEALIDRAGVLGETSRLSAPCDVHLRGNGWELSGRLDGQVPDGQVRVRAATVNAADRVQGWIAHVLVNVVRGPSTTRLVGRKNDTGFAPCAGAPGPQGPGTDAMALLDALLLGYRRMLTAPVPYFPEAAAACWKARHDPLKAREDARRAYHRIDGFARGDIENPYVALLWRGRDPVVEDWDDFVAMSALVWEPLLASEAAFGASGRRA